MANGRLRRRQPQQQIDPHRLEALALDGEPALERLDRDMQAGQ